MNVRVFGIESKYAKPFALIYGNSTETKPVGRFCGGSKFFETDTDKEYRYDDTDNVWYEIDYTINYDDLKNKPKVDGVELQGDKEAYELFLTPTDGEHNRYWAEKYSTESKPLAGIYLSNIDGVFTDNEVWLGFLEKVKELCEDGDVLPYDLQVPYSPQLSCLVTKIDLDNRDVTVDGLCYSNGKRIVVSQITDSEGRDIYKLHVIDLAEPADNKVVPTIVDNVWTIEHNLCKYPTLDLRNNDGDIIEAASIEYVDCFTVRVTFSEPVEGYAILN